MNSCAILTISLWRGEYDSRNFFIYFKVDFPVRVFEVYELLIQMDYSQPTVVNIQIRSNTQIQSQGPSDQFEGVHFLRSANVSVERAPLPHQFWR